MRVKIRDSGQKHSSPEERFTVGTDHRVDEVSVSMAELCLEGYGPTEVEAIDNFMRAANALIERLQRLTSTEEKKS